MAAIDRRKHQNSKITFYSLQLQLMCRQCTSLNNVRLQIVTQILMVLILIGKLSDEMNINNNNKWTGSCNSILQTTNKTTNHLGSINHHHNLHHHQNHHTSHHAAVAALSSPFSSLLGASGGAGYLLDPLGSLNKTTAAANHLF